MKKFYRLVLIVLVFFIVSNHISNNAKIFFESNLTKNGNKEQYNINYEKEIFGPYVNIDETSIRFDKHSFYNYLNGQSNILTDEEVEEFRVKADKLQCIAETMNALAKEGVGTFNQNGDFIPFKQVNYEPVSSQEVINDIKNKASHVKEIQIIDEQKNFIEKICSIPFCKNWSWNFWTGFDILFGAPGSILMGILGIIMNADSWRKSLSIEVKITPKQYLTAGLLDNPTILEIYLSQLLPQLVQNSLIQFAIEKWELTLKGIGDVVSFMTSCFFFALGIIDILTNATGFKLIMKIILAIVSLYLPDMVTGFMLVFGGFIDFADTKAYISWIYSDYEIVYS